MTSEFSTIFTDIFDKHAPNKSDINDLASEILLIMKFQRQSWREVGSEIVFWQNRSEESYFANIEISAFCFCENLKKTMSQT